MACFDDNALRVQRRSFTSSTGSVSSDHMVECDDAIDVMFERVQNYKLPVQPAYFSSSPASSQDQLDPIPQLEQDLFEMNLLKRSLPPERNSTVSGLHRAQRAGHRVHDRCATTGYRILTMSSLIQNADLVLPSVRPRHVPAPIQVRPHHVYRSISLSTLPPIVGTPR